MFASEFLCTSYFATTCTGNGTSLSVLNRIFDISPVEMNTNIENSVALVRQRTIQTKRPPLVGKVSANICWCSVVSATNSHGCILGFVDRRRYHFFQVAPQLYFRS
jgi:hypothetical protein